MQTSISHEGAEIRPPSDSGTYPHTKSYYQPWSRQPMMECALWNSRCLPASTNMACKEAERESDGIPAETIRGWWYDAEKKASEKVGHLGQGKNNDQL